MTEIFKKLLLKKETPFLSKIVHFRHEIAKFEASVVIINGSLNRGYSKAGAEHNRTTVKS